jgi:hypothetical protein
VISLATGQRKRIVDQFRALFLSRAFRTLRGQKGDRPEALLQVRHTADQTAARRIELEVSLKRSRSEPEDYMAGSGTPASH